MRCMLKIIYKLDLGEARDMREHFLVDFYNSQYATAMEGAINANTMDLLHVPTIVKEAIERRCHRQAGSDTEEEMRCSPLSFFRRLTVESDKLENFPVEKGGTTLSSPCAAWLYGKSTVLTCRVGSSTSHCRGYVEIVLRSPLERHRVLVPIPGKVALENPEFPSIRRRGPGESDTQLRSAPHANVRAIQLDSTDALDQAASVLERFESVMAEGAEVSDEEDDYQSRGEVDDDIDDFSSELRESTAPLLLGEQTVVLTQTSTEPEPNLIAPRSESIVGWCFRDWLLSVFAWSKNDDDLVERQLADYLQPYGFNVSSVNDSVTFDAYELFNEQSKPLRHNQKLERAIAILDRTAPSNTYKFSLLYLGPDQAVNENTTAESRLLSTTVCSPAFHNFASQLGDMTPTKYLRYFSAGLDVSPYESDGRYTLAWSSPDHSDFITWHVANLMPVGLNKRKRHIANDNVLVLFDESLPVWAPHPLKTYAAPIVSGHFNFATILVKMLPQHDLFRVVCRIRSDLEPHVDAVLCSFAGDNLVSEKRVAGFVRSLAMEIDTACRAIIDGLPPPSNSLERCRQIFELKRYAL